MVNVVVCDDEKDIVSAIKIYLSTEEVHILEAYNGQEAIDLVRKEDVQLLVMDIMMPGKDGLQAMSEIRAFSNIPIILLTAKSEDMDKILGLTVGADDYITKPFNPIELQARVKSQLRRYIQLGSGKPKDNVLTVGGIELDDCKKEVTLDGEKVFLTPTEYDILKLLLEHPNQVFSPKQIYEKVWQDNPCSAENTVAVHIRHLREKIEYDPTHPQHLKVVWGHGYKIES